MYLVILLAHKIKLNTEKCVSLRLGVRLIDLLGLD